MELPASASSMLAKSHRRKWRFNWVNTWPV
jgi:hypothetical protein